MIFSGSSECHIIVVRYQPSVGSDIVTFSIKNMCFLDYICKVPNRNRVSSLAISNDEAFFLISLADGIFLMYNLSTGTEIREIKGKLPIVPYVK